MTKCSEVKLKVVLFAVEILKTFKSPHMLTNQHQHLFFCVIIGNVLLVTFSVVPLKDP